MQIEAAITYSHNKSDPRAVAKVGDANTFYDSDGNVLAGVTQPQFSAFSSPKSVSVDMKFLRIEARRLARGLLVPVIHQGEHPGRRRFAVDRGDPYFAELQRLKRAARYHDLVCNSGRFPRTAALLPIGALSEPSSRQ